MKVLKMTTKPLCLQCMLYPAEPLVRLGNTQAIFCSMACAALFGLEFAGDPALYVWCSEHKRWSDCGGGCPTRALS